MEKCLSVYISSLPSSFLCQSPHQHRCRNWQSCEHFETSLHITKWCKGQSCSMSIRMVCCTLLFFCSHVQIFFIKRRAAKWNSLWKTLFKQPVMFGLVGCVLWLNSCDHPLCLTYWRSLIPAVAVLTVGLVCCTAIHPWRKGNHTAKDEPIDELQGYCNSTRDDGATKIGFRILGGAVIDSSSPPPPKLTCLIVTSTTREMVTSMRWAAHLKSGCV